MSAHKQQSESEESVATESQPAANVENEARLLATLLAAPELDLWPKVRTILLEPQYHYREAHRLIWQVGCEIYDRGGVPEPHAIRDELQATGRDPDNTVREVVYALEGMGYAAPLWTRDEPEIAERWLVDMAGRIKRDALKRFLIGPSTTLAGYAYNRSDDATAEEVQHNPAFAERVRVAYSLVPATEKRGAGGSSRTTTPKALAIDLVPVKHVEGFTLNPAAPVDPYLVYEAYGSDQLAAVLDLFPPDKVKAAAALVEQRNPGGPRANRGSKATVIEYIVRELTASR